MGFSPANLRLNYNKTHSVNGNLSSGFDIGIVFPKGIFIHILGKKLFISKDGIASMLIDGYHGSCGWGFLKSWPIRLLMLLEAILFLLSLPFQLIIYTLIILVGFLAGLVLLPTCCCEFRLCGKERIIGMVATNRNMCRIAWVYFACSLLSLIYILAYIVLIPFQILFPELCVYALQYHKWGTTKFDYL